MSNTSFKSSPLTPLLGLSESFFQSSPCNSSSDSSFGLEWRKKNNLNQVSNSRNSRTFSPGSRFVKSPNISPIIKNFGNLTINEEPEPSDKTFVIHENCEDNSSSLTPHTPINKTYIIKHRNLFEKNIGAAKAISLEREKILKRRTLFLIPPTPPSINVSKLNASDFEHKFTVDTILKEIGMTKYINLFRMEEINIPAFLTLNDEDLKTIGIMDPEERSEIIKAVEAYQFLK